MRYLLAIFLLGLLVALHELGHLIAARACRMKVERFAVGFGPPLLAVRRRGTEYSLRAIPFGGFVRISGMEVEGDAPAPGSYASRPRWQRALVLFAGSAVNYLIAIGLLFAYYAGGAPVPVPRTVGVVAPGSEAARVQLRPGDEVLSVDGQPVNDWSDLVEAVTERPGPLALSVRRDDQVLEVRATPRPDEAGVPRLGVGQLYSYRKLSAKEAASQAVRHSVALVRGGLEGTWALLRGRPDVSLAGPVGIAQRTASASTAGLGALLGLLAAISVALAVFNLLPVPGLDGGKLLLLGIAAVRGKPADPRLEALANAAGFFALIALAIWVTVRDVRGVRATAAREDTTAADAGVPADAGAVTLDAGAADAGAGARPDGGAAPDAGALQDAGAAR